MGPEDILIELGLTGAAWAVPIGGGPGVGFNEHRLVTPASVMKVQIALTVEDLIAAGRLDGASPRRLPAAARTPGPVGISLMRDDVIMSVRDLVVAMLTVSDNVATDELLALVGLDEVNRRTGNLGLAHTRIISDLGTMLDQLAGEVGFDDYAGLAAHDPAADGPPSREELVAGIAASAALDPGRGSRTTASDVVRLLRAIWTDAAGDPAACWRVREVMASQLTRARLASGFPASVGISAKSGGLLGVVRNEVGVVGLPDGRAYAVAVFTRREPPNNTDPAVVDTAIGRVARALVDELSGD